MKYKIAWCVGLVSGLGAPLFAQTENQSHELEEVVVVATRTEKNWIDTSGSVSRVTAEELLNRGAQDLGDISKYDPTIHLPFDFASGDGAYAYAQSGYGSINIRGTEGNRIAIELDGVRQPPQYVSTSFDQSDEAPGGIGRDYYDPAMFEMVEILKGGASALYGSDAMGGVVSFSTPSPASLLGGKSYGGLLRSQYFDVNESYSFQGSGAFRIKDTSGLLLFVYREGEETKNNGKIAPNPVDFESEALLFKLEHILGDHTFRATLENYKRDTELDAQSAVQSRFAVFNDYVYNRQQIERQRASLEWEYDVRHNWLDRIESHLYWQSSETVSENDSGAKPVGPFNYSRKRQQQIDFQTDIVGLTSVFKKEIEHDHSISQTWISGIDLSREKSENIFARWEDGVFSDKISFAPTDTERAGLFIQDEIRFGQQWFLTAGLRMDHTSIDPNPNEGYLQRLAEFGRYVVINEPESYDNLSISPRLSLAYKPRNWFQYYGTYSHGVRDPSAEELSMIFAHPPTGGSSSGTVTIPNPDLKEETSDSFEIGMKADGNVGRFHTAVYYTRYSDFIENGVPTGVRDDENRDIVTTVNRGKTDIYGFEIGGKWNAASWLTQLEGLEISLSTGKSIGIDRDNKQWINTVDPWRTVGFIGYNNTDYRFGVRLTGTYTDKVTHVNDETNLGEFYRPDSWMTFDLAAHWSPFETFSIHAGINNLFDEEYWTWGTVRRGNGHLGGNSVTDQTTAPGRNFFISLTKTF
ncbi:MAG: TonB-dependent hemoglobin/transferrin/lactoferrin family receptor [Luteolibacter sp.]